MDTDSTQETTPRARLAAIVARRPELAEAKIESIPARTDGGWKDDKDGAAHWRISFGQGSGAFAVEYSRGEAHRRWTKASAFESITGGFPAGFHRGMSVSAALGRCRYGSTRGVLLSLSEPMPPDAVDVVSALCMDAECYDGARDWRDFCVELGYGDDSIRGRDAYYACERAAKYLRRTLGADYEAAIEAAREL